MNAASRYERAVAFYINTFDNVIASRPNVSTSYSDVFVQFRGVPSWIEVKMNENDQMANTRIFYDAEWCSAKNGPIQKYIKNRVNDCEGVRSFVEEISDFSRIRDPYISTTVGGLKKENAVPLQVMKDFFETKENNYIYEEKNVDLSKLISDHYNFGKIQPAHYISAGDQFLQLGDQDPLGLKLPRLNGTGDLKIRVVCRSNYYDIQPDIKIKKLEESPYSIAPGTDKPHPFVL